MLLSELWLDANACLDLAAPPSCGSCPKRRLLQGRYGAAAITPSSGYRPPSLAEQLSRFQVGACTRCKTIAHEDAAACLPSPDSRPSLTSSHRPSLHRPPRCQTPTSSSHPRGRYARDPAWARRQAPPPPGWAAGRAVWRRLAAGGQREQQATARERQQQLRQQVKEAERVQRRERRAACLPGWAGAAARGPLLVRRRRRQRGRPQCSVGSDNVLHSNSRASRASSSSSSSSRGQLGRVPSSSSSSSRRGQLGRVPSSSCS